MEKNHKKYEALHLLLKKEVVPALGCTEPIALALAVAKAREILGFIPEHISIFTSLNIYKNGMGVGIPGTNMQGLPIAAALGALAGDSDKELEVLSAVKPQDVEEAKAYLNDGKIDIKIKDICNKLYVEVVCTYADLTSTAIIENNHRNFVYLSLNDKILLNKRENCLPGEEQEEIYDICMEDIYDFACHEKLDKIRYIEDLANENKKLSDFGLKNKSGMGIGSHLMEWIKKTGENKDFTQYAMALTAAASDARMSGASLPAISNSGSGNQGITAMVPILAVAEKLGSSKEQLIRALILSNLTVIHIKRHFGRLSAACGCVVASTGSACGVCYLLGGSKEQIYYAIKNMVGNLAGMLCDGAKLGCALKVSSGTSAAIQSAILALSNVYVPSNNGIIEEDIEKTIRNLGIIANKAMCDADKVILNIMLGK